MVRFNGAFLWYNAAQISVGDDDSGLRAVLESAHGPVAQLDRASDFGSEGWGFDSLRGRHSKSRFATCKVTRKRSCKRQFCSSLDTWHQHSSYLPAVIFRGAMAPAER